MLMCDDDAVVSALRVRHALVLLPSSGLPLLHPQCASWPPGVM